MLCRGLEKEYRYRGDKKVLRVGLEKKYTYIYIYIYIEREREDENVLCGIIEKE